MIDPYRGGKCTLVFELNHQNNKINDPITSFEYEVDFDEVITKGRSTPSEVNWEIVSYCAPFPIEFIDEFKQYLHWEVISERQEFTEEYLIEMKMKGYF